MLEIIPKIVHYGRDTKRHKAARRNIAWRRVSIMARVTERVFNISKNSCLCRIVAEMICRARAPHHIVLLHRCVRSYIS